ncbi:MAG: hypothetical protein OXB93_01910 [Cytophagales bacterium]|nr:hypothetical protein [Cytophagales bacterium]
MPFYILEAYSFSVRYQGPGVNRHEIEAKELAHSLLSLSDLLQKVADGTYGKDKAKVTLRVKATQEGSFEVLLALEIWGQIKDFFNSDDYNAIKEILYLLYGSHLGKKEFLPFING